MEKRAGQVEELDAQELLHMAIANDILSVGDIQSMYLMKKKEKVDQMHSHAVWQGKGKDNRFFTYIPVPDAKNGRKKIAKTTEKELYDFLYDFYYEDKNTTNNASLQEVYREWLHYKNTLANRSNYIRRIDNDYQKFYVKEPLSNDILTKPLRTLNKIEIETWAYALIKKYNLSKKSYYNMSLILRQVIQYMIDKEVLTSNPYDRVKIPGTKFRKVRKPKSETQIFYADEINEIINMAENLAVKSRDENYLAIPLIFRSGIRIGECLGLEFTDFDREENMIFVHRSFVSVEHLNADGSWDKRRYEVIDQLKHNAEPREILVTDKCFELVDMIREIKESKNGEEKRLFVVDTPAEIEYKLYSICEKLGYTKRSTHKIRKTYISELVNNKIDLDFIREQVGHSNIQTTLNSYTFSTTRQKEKLNQLERVLD